MFIFTKTFIALSLILFACGAACITSAHAWDDKPNSAYDRYLDRMNDPSPEREPATLYRKKRVDDPYDPYAGDRQQAKSTRERIRQDFEPIYEREDVILQRFPDD